MSDYKREVYYLYNYENGHKKNNIGFARIEQLNGQCRMTIRIRVPSMNGKTLDICLFAREDGEMRFLPVGRLKINNMVGECRMRVDANDIMGSGYALHEMEGMVIYDSLEKFFGSEWKEQKISFKEFKLLSDRKKEEVTALEEEDRKEPDSKEGELLTAASVEILEEAVTECKTEENKALEEPMDLLKNRQEEREEEELPGLPEIFFQFPKMQPFEDDEMTDCIRIEPQDIGRLPMESWILANNSFLLHSYYSYRHLLLARRRCSSGFEYVLCAPGICQNREQFMAAMFGFCDFKPIKHVEDNNGEFGYWYMPIIIDG